MKKFVLWLCIQIHILKNFKFELWVFFVMNLADTWIIHLNVLVPPPLLSFMMSFTHIACECMWKPTLTSLTMPKEVPPNAYSFTKQLPLCQPSPIVHGFRLKSKVTIYSTMWAGKSKFWSLTLLPCKILLVECFLLFFYFLATFSIFSVSSGPGDVIVVVRSCRVSSSQSTCNMERGDALVIKWGSSLFDFG